MFAPVWASTATLGPLHYTSEHVGSQSSPLPDLSVSAAATAGGNRSSPAGLTHSLGMCRNLSVDLGRQRHGPCGRPSAEWPASSVVYFANVRNQPVMDRKVVLEI